MSTRGSDHGGSRNNMDTNRSRVSSPPGKGGGTSKASLGAAQWDADGPGKGDYKWTDQFLTNPAFSLNPWASIANGLEAEYFELKKVSDFFDYGKKNVPSNNYGGAILSCGITKGRLKLTLKIKSVSGGLLVGASRLDMPVGVHWLEHQNCNGMVWLYQCPGGGFWNGPKQVLASDMPQSAEGRKRAAASQAGSTREVLKQGESSYSVQSTDSKRPPGVSPQGSQASVGSGAKPGVSPQGSTHSVGKPKPGVSPQGSTHSVGKSKSGSKEKGKAGGGIKPGVSPQNSKSSVSSAAGSKKHS
eukprot:CAMPEP_0114136186 /NCGR_PEP_ID=MMETSP0043_2-20121206/15073_1 /TAXON_ID=464988 /ORGANISM="Hemiselmis andersenii, Strain CCMP644" /LENGTH=300 /DNA_ID=CAMNT_0001229909 /DNA_START=180 /DNA_END=1078 /DNA_ORIENTATION=+